jgi:hypothetical protein
MNRNIKTTTTSNTGSMNSEIAAPWGPAPGAKPGV